MNNNYIIPLYYDAKDIANIDIFESDRLAGWYHCYVYALGGLRFSIGSRFPFEIECRGLRSDVMQSDFGIAECGFDIKVDPPIGPEEVIEISSVATGSILYRGNLVSGLAIPVDIMTNASPPNAVEVGNGAGKQFFESDTLIVLDLSDLVLHIGSHENLSGIQRMQASIILAIVKNNLADRNHLIFICYETGRDRFLRIKTDYIVSLLEDLMRPLGARTVSFDRTQAQNGVLPHSSLLDAALVHKKQETVLCLLGSAWANPSYFGTISNLKRDLNAKFAMVLYDLIPLVLPNTCDEGLVAAFQNFIDQALIWTDKFLCISHNSARDLDSYAEGRSDLRPVNAIIHAGSSFDEFISVGHSMPANEAVQGPYVLMVSTIEGRKNHRLMFDVWSQLIREMPQAPTLICVGRLGWRAEDFVHRLVASDYLNGKIVLLEDVSDLELNWLYENCLFTVFPSRYEGWGLPVGESLSKGKICVTSRNSSLPEVGGDCAVYVDIEEPRSVVATIKHLVSDAAHRKKLEKNIIENYVAITWRSVAEKVVAACKSLSGSEPKGLWPAVEIGREYTFREPRRLARNIAGAAMLNDIKMMRRGTLISDFLSDESFQIPRAARHGRGWSNAEDWGIWSLYQYSPELWFSLPPEAGPEVEWYALLRVGPGLEGRNCKVTVGGRLVADIQLPNGRGLLRIGQLRTGVTPESRHFAVCFSIEKDKALEDALRSVDERMVAIGFESMIFLNSRDYEARLRFLENCAFSRLC